ncbi:MAG TPA: hypothetical protein VD996_03900, partial [Chitinophagaceae bacterium]|nr:hypothetical protein [Chitinophagaceae bacterium]
AYYLFKQTIIRKEAGINKLNEQTDLGALAIVNRIKQQHPSVIICSNNHELVNIASLSGAPVLYDYQIMNDSLKTSKPVMMLFIAQDKYEDRFRPFMDRYKPAKVGHSYGFSFYLAAIR